jgi:hypothetical protein
MTTTETATARPAGRPRSEKAEKAIIEATLDLIGEGMGVSELSIEAIAHLPALVQQGGPGRRRAGLAQGAGSHPGGRLGA